MNVSDLIITVAYFSIPIQILISLWQYPRLARMPIKIVILVVLFAFFIFMCGAGHLLRCLDRTDTDAFIFINALTAAVSLITALYLLPLIPHLMGSLDQSLEDLVNLNQETSESKDKLFTFMAFLCHEIRNPLFAITSSASFLADTDMTEEQEIGVGSIFDSSLLMLRLVNDVLDLSKIDAGKLELEVRDFDLRRLLYNLENNMRMQVAQKHGDKVKLNFAVSPDVPTIVHGDSVRFLQIIYNLISNSNKFTSEGEIGLAIGVTELEVDEEDEDDFEDEPASDSAVNGGIDTARHRRRINWRKSTSFRVRKKKKSRGASRRNSDESLRNDDGAGGNGDITFSMSLLAAEEGRHDEETSSRYRRIAMAITVSDTGIGIAPERIEKIFEPYSQSKLSDYRKHGGTGLGLSILSSLTKLMGGTIHVESEIDKGTKITCSLPILALREESQHQACAPSLEDPTIDMSDPFLSARRLPVYSSSSPDKPNQHCGSISSSVHEHGLHHDDAGIKFFSPSSNGSGNVPAPAPPPAPSAPSTQNFKPRRRHSTMTPTDVEESQPKPVAKPKKPRLPPFDLPPGRLVLVTDDNAINRKIIGRMLTYFSVPYDEAENGLEAVKLLRKRRDEKKSSDSASAPHYALVFMDLSMPIMDGYDAIETLRKENIAVPVVALTANALSQERERALSLGANEFHTKPILRNDLHKICARYLRKPSGRHKEGRPPELVHTGSSEHDSSGSSRRNGLKSSGESYREGVSMLVRHDSAVT